MRTASAPVADALHAIIAIPLPAPHPPSLITFPCIPSPQVVCVDCRSELSITCPEGQLIQVTDTFYGRDNNQQCAGPNMQVTDCGGEVPTVNELCDGSQSCSVQACSLLADPCWGVMKCVGRMSVPVHVAPTSRSAPLATAQPLLPSPDTRPSGFCACRMCASASHRRLRRRQPKSRRALWSRSARTATAPWSWPAPLATRFASARPFTAASLSLSARTFMPRRNPVVWTLPRRGSISARASRRARCSRRATPTTATR